MDTFASRDPLAILADLLFEEYGIDIDPVGRQDREAVVDLVAHPEHIDRYAPPRSVFPAGHKWSPDK